MSDCRFGVSAVNYPDPEDCLVIFTIFSTNRRVYSFSINDVGHLTIAKNLL